MHLMVMSFESFKIQNSLSPPCPTFFFHAIDLIKLVQFFCRISHILDLFTCLCGLCLLHVYKLEVSSKSLIRFRFFFFPLGGISISNIFRLPCPYLRLISGFRWCWLDLSILKLSISLLCNVFTFY